MQNAVITECINDMNDSLDIVKAHVKETGNVHSLTLSDLGIENVENKSSADIRGELTKEDIIKALGYEPSGGNGGDGTGGGEPSNPNVTIKTFEQATDEEIIQMVQAADAGQIDLADDCGWEVGQEHMITLPAIAKSGEYDGQSWSVGEEQPEQRVTLVLMDIGENQTFNLVSPVKDRDGNDRIKPKFIVGLKNSLSISGYIGSYAGSTAPWTASQRRKWLNAGFRQAMEAVFPNTFKQFKCITAKNQTSSENMITDDYFSLFAEKEIAGICDYSIPSEANVLNQIQYYVDIDNRQKFLGNTGYLDSWWERSPKTSNNALFCYIKSDGTCSNDTLTFTKGISPFGCI